MRVSETEYPKEAYCPLDGRLWWDRGNGDGPRGAEGSVPRMASWLRWNVRLNERFTTKAMRAALGVGHEHFQRRQRELREDLGWRYLSSKEEPSLGDECILLEYGWWPGDGERPKKASISNKVRRQVFERDGGRCVLCGLAAQESYEDGGVVVLTAGHIRANLHGGSISIDNLHTECRRCNETARADTGNVADPVVVLERVKNLTKADRIEMLGWLQSGRRTRSKLDLAYDDVRLGGPRVRQVVLDYLEQVASY